VFGLQPPTACAHTSDLTLDFSPKTTARKNQLLQDLQLGAIYRVEGS